MGYNLRMADVNLRVQEMDLIEMKCRQEGDGEMSHALHFLTAVNGEKGRGIYFRGIQIQIQNGVHKEKSKDCILEWCQDPKTGGTSSTRNVSG